MAEQKLPTSAEQAETVTPDAIMQLGVAFWGSKTLLSAVELKVFQLLCETGPQGCDELRHRLGLHPRSAQDFFDALLALGMLRGVTRRAGYPTRRRPSSSSTRRSRSVYRWPTGDGQLSAVQILGLAYRSTRTGETQSEAKTGDDFFATLYADPEKLAEFAGAMSGLSSAAGQAIAAKFPWKDYKSLVDIGCAQGALPVAVASAHEHWSEVGSTCRRSGRCSTHMHRHGSPTA